MKNAPYVTAAETDIIKISIATTPEEKREIYRLRYAIYAEEIGYDLTCVDHKNQLLFDDLDEWAILLSVRIGSTIIGTGRLNIGRLSDFPNDVIQTFRMDKFKEFYSKNDDPCFAVISKGMISPQYRSSQALNKIMEKLYNLYCIYQVQFAFVNCNFHLISLHEHYGSRRIDKNILDINVGPLASFVMLVDDVEYLQTVNSPLFSIAAKRTSLNTKVIDWFQKDFSHELKTTINSQLVSSDDLWDTISHCLGNMSICTLPIFKGLLVSEIKLFLYVCGIIVHCHLGDYIAMGGNTSQELIILLSGTAQASLQDPILPKHICGNNGLVTRTTHSCNVVAISDANILVLSYHYFKKFRKEYPDVAYKIVQNLQAKQA